MSNIEQANTNPTCCGNGGSWAPKPGEPVVVGCQVCPNSPTYWAKDKPADRQEARLG